MGRGNTEAGSFDVPLAETQNGSKAVIPSVWNSAPLGLEQSKTQQAWKIPKDPSMRNLRSQPPSLTGQGTVPGFL